jgi:transcriptional regulator with XRE-family HTH domain
MVSTFLTEMTSNTGQRMFTEMLEEARKRQGLSKVRAAAMLGTSPTTYRQWLRGQRPDWEWVDRLIEFTGEDELAVLVALRYHGPPTPNDVSSPTASLRRQTVDYGHSRKGRRPQDHRPPRRYAPNAA